LNEIVTKRKQDKGSEEDTPVAKMVAKKLTKSVDELSLKERKSGAPLRRSGRRRSNVSFTETQDSEDEEEEEPRSDESEEARGLPGDEKENSSPVAQVSTPIQKLKKKYSISTLAEEAPREQGHLSDESDEDGEEFPGLSSIPKRKQDADIDLDFVSSPPSAVFKRFRA
jgi:hypothetical protein